MKITIDTNEDRKELVKVIRMLQQIVDDHGHHTHHSKPMDIFADVPNPYANSQPVTQDKPKDHSVPGLFDMFSNDPPASLDPKNDKEDDDDPMESIRVVEF